MSTSKSTDKKTVIKSADTRKSGMGTWKLRIFGKKTKGSQTTGKSKGIVSSPLIRTICRRNRSYKMREYGAIMAKLTGEKVRKKV